MPGGVLSADIPEIVRGAGSGEYLDILEEAGFHLGVGHKRDKQTDQYADGLFQYTLPLNFRKDRMTNQDYPELFKTVSTNVHKWHTNAHKLDRGKCFHRAICENLCIIWEPLWIKKRKTVHR